MQQSACIVFTLMFQLRCLAEKMCVGVEGGDWIVGVVAVTLRKAMVNSVLCVTVVFVKSV